MKTQNLLMTVICLLFLGMSSHAQPFEMAYHGTYGPPPWYPLYASDFQHYSIEATPSGEYVLAGTVLDSNTGNTDIHVFKIDISGTIIWEVNIDYAGLDDGALDVVVDPNDDIIITGFVCGSPNLPEMYVAKYDPAGNLLADNIIGAFPTAASAGTNIIYSTSTGNYIVGGFHDDPPVMHPLVDGEAVLVELDPNLNPMATCFLSLTGTFDDHTSINDIVEVPGVGYYTTGSYESSATTQGVLLVMVDLGLNIMNDLSFNDGSWDDQRGVSVFYDAGPDEIILVSNHNTTADPQIRRIVGASGGGAIAQEMDINLFDQTMAPVDGSVFQIMECPWNPSSIVLAGRFKFAPGSVDNQAWLLQLDKASFGVLGGMVWNVTSPNYESFAPTVMGPLFSTWVGPHPYIYNEEIITHRIDMAGLVLVAPTDIAAPNYGINVVSTNAMAALGCYDPIRAILSPIGHVPDPLTWTPAGVSASSPWLWDPRQTGMDWNCLDPTLPRTPLTGDGVEDGDNAPVASIEDIGDISVSVSPNPSNGQFNVIFEGENVQGTFQITNSVGQVVYRSEQISGSNYTTTIDLSNYDHGVYILQFTDGERQLIEKLIKL